jgi:nitrite reductase/ring-hydroxylating ferredoxin subunit/DMSO/TMAO reductase YedYZ heme-binding membrane subunit
MGHTYQAVGWSPQKKRYDLVLAGAIALYLALFAALGAVLRPELTLETLLIRGLGTAAFLSLHVVLAIGPLCRLDRRFLPLLYNRRHLGVATFLLGLAHGAFALVQFHALGDRNPLLSLLTSNTRVASLPDFPFQQLGAGALLILFAMAATSHDVWLAALTPPVWKTLHMAVYLAYALLVGHVALGALQQERSPLLAAVLGLGLLLLLGLHLAAGWRERAPDRALEATASAASDGFVPVCAAAEIPESRARTVCLAGERVAVFRYDGRISAVSAVCRHQNGPLGEGKIVDGCITCPWHGYQYLPGNGSAPPPFTEKLPTFRVRVENGRVLVHPRPLPAGTPVEPAMIDAP